MKRTLGLVAVLSVSMATATTQADFANPAGESPLEMEYLVTDLGGGLFEYDFWLILDNGDGSWFPGQEFAWLIFGDQQSAPSPLTNFVGDPDDLPIGPWTFYTSSGGFHNGPTLGPVLDPWIPSDVGESLHWSGTSTANLPQGELLFSSIVGTGNRPDFQVATLIPAPGVMPLLGLGVLALGRRRRGHEGA